jgi:transposase
VQVPIVKCKSCGAQRQIDLKIADPKKTYTKGFARDVLKLLKEMSVLAVARLLGVSWFLICSILKSYLEGRYPKKDLKNLRHIAIDEISVGKGHNYLTIVYDLDAKEPVFVGDGKAESALEPFWKKLGPVQAKKIECVSIDMGAAFQAAVRHNIPHADIVFDHFHVVKLANEYVDNLRRSVITRSNFEGKNFVTGNRFLLLKNPENLDPRRNEPERLQRLLDLNSPMTEMYILKEDLRQFWDLGSREEADKAIDTWVETANSSKEPLIKRLAGTIAKFKEGITNYYNHEVSSGPLEGFNNKIKALVRRAYGYKNREFFKLVILASNEFAPNRVAGVDLD